MDKKKLMYDWLIGMLGTQYRYGGRNRLEGLDCSQLVFEFLISAGRLPHGDDGTAQGLFGRFYTHKYTSSPRFGDLAFYGKNVDQIAHVGICMDDVLMIEAGGGDSTVKSFDQAVERSAMVRIRPIKYRKDFLGVVQMNLFE